MKRLLDKPLPLFSALRVLNLHHQASPVSRTPSMPAVDTSYIPPVPPLIQDYRPYYHTPNDLSGNDKHTQTQDDLGIFRAASSSLGTTNWR